VVHAQEGCLTGYNTDVIGLLKTLEEQNCQLQGKNVLIWGAGGAARAAAYAVGTLGVKNVFILNQNQARAEKLIRDLSQKGLRLKNSQLEMQSVSFERAGEIPLGIRVPLSLVIHATPLGMKGLTSTPEGQSISEFFSPLSHFEFEKGALAFDLIYNPIETPFLHLAHSLGLKTIGGLGMLIDQALATWEIWMGPLRDSYKLKAALREFLSQEPKEQNGSGSPVFLTGFMGVGKSTVGKMLADKIGPGWSFVDSDRLIEQNCGCSVADIFERQGETAFRALEKKIIGQLSQAKNTVIALGGGALLDLENLQTVQNAGPLIYLTAEVSTLLERLNYTTHRGVNTGANSAASRPLLSLSVLSLSQFPETSSLHNLLEKKILDLMAKREVAYQAVSRAASIQVRTDGKNPEEVTQILIEALGGGRL
jgi:shikimate dehydrogenase